MKANKKVGVFRKSDYSKESLKMKWVGKFIQDTLVNKIHPWMKLLRIYLCLFCLELKGKSNVGAFSARICKRDKKLKISTWLVWLWIPKKELTKKNLMQMTYGKGIRRNVSISLYRINQYLSYQYVRVHILSNHFYF